MGLTTKEEKATKVEQTACERSLRIGFREVPLFANLIGGIVFSIGPSLVFAFVWCSSLLASLRSKILLDRMDLPEVVELPGLLGLTFVHLDRRCFPLWFPFEEDLRTLETSGQEERKRKYSVDYLNLYEHFRRLFHSHA